MAACSLGRIINAAFVGRSVAFRGCWTRTTRRLIVKRVFPLSETNNDDDTIEDDSDANQDIYQSLVGGALGRVTETMSIKTSISNDIDDTKSTLQSMIMDIEAAIDDSDAPSIDKELILQQSLRASTDSLLQGAVGRAMRTLSTKATTREELDLVSEAKLQEVVIGSDGITITETLPTPTEQQMDPYLSNPAITPTALAHQMWAHAIRPNVDTVIDATCGNGNDSVAIASMLFNDNDNDPFTITRPQLLCIDIQEEACQTTRGRLAKILHQDTMTCNVNVLCTSHSPLPRPRDESSVGLVVYNLGYLPQSDRVLLTQMESTISSITDAALMLRVGGALSVTTYPRSNKNEDYAVHALLEGLALLSSKSTDWRRDYLDELGPDPDTTDGENEYSVRDAVRAALERIVDEGPPKQTWRVLENKMLGRSLSPILLTATRIK